MNRRELRVICVFFGALSLLQCQALLGIREREVAAGAESGAAGAAAAAGGATGVAAAAGAGATPESGAPSAGNDAPSAGSVGLAGESTGGLAASGNNSAIAGQGPEGGGGGAAPAPCDQHAPFGAPTRIAELSSLYSDEALRLSADGLTAYFTSDRNGNGTRFLPGYDLFEAYRSDVSAAFGTPHVVSEVSEPPPHGELDSTATADGLTMYFDAYRPTRHIWRATRASGGQWNEQSEVTVLSSINEEMDPYVVPDHAALYFTSTRSSATSDQGYNLFVALLSAGEVVGFQEVAGVNTQLDERHAVVTADQRRIFFSRNVREGSMVRDIFEASREDVAEPFAGIRSVLELNTATSEYPSWVSPDGCALYFTSDRTGNEDFYVARRGSAP